jgi:hypothetical protein
MLTSSWNLRQVPEEPIDWLCGDYDPHDLEPALKVKVGRLNENLCDWPRDAVRVRIPSSAGANATELVLVWLGVGEKECRWVQVAPISGFQADDRDHAVMARFLGVRTFLSWIRSMLEDSAVGHGGGDWTSPPDHSTSPGANSDLEVWAPSLEQALKAWVRNPEQLKRADNILTRYLDSMREPQDKPHTEEEKEALDAIGKVWPVIRRELLGIRRPNIGAKR